MNRHHVTTPTLLLLTVGTVILSIFPHLIQPLHTQTVQAISSTDQASAQTNQRHTVQTSDGTLHQFVQLGTNTASCGSGGLWWMTSNDHGQNWTCRSQLFGNTQTYNGDARVDSDNIYVTYSQFPVDGIGIGANFNVYYRKLSYQGGSTWTVGAQQTVVDSTNYGGAIGSSMEIADNRIWVAAKAFNRGYSLYSIVRDGSGNYLIGGESGRLLLYNGTTFTDLTSQANFGSSSIKAISYNSTDNYFLIGGGDVTSSTGKKLLKYQSGSFTDLTSSMAWSGTLPIQTISYNSTDNYFLIGGGDRDTTSGSRLNRYNGTTFTDLSSQLGGLTYAVLSIAYNSTDNYFLIGGGDADACTASTKLYKYSFNGGVDTTTDLSSSLTNFANCSVLSIAYNSTNNYFLIGGGNALSGITTPSLNKYEEVGGNGTFTDLSTLMVSYGTNVQTISYNQAGNYFILAGGADSNGSTNAKMNKYNGSAFSSVAIPSSTNSNNATIPLGIVPINATNDLYVGGTTQPIQSGSPGNSYGRVGIGTVGASPASLLAQVEPYVGDGLAYVKAYYSSNMGDQPNWTAVSQKMVLSGINTNGIPYTIKFSNKLGIMYTNQISALAWRTHNNGDSPDTWSSESTVSGNMGTTMADLMATVDSQNYVHVASINGSGQLRYSFFNGTSWSTSLLVGSALTSSRHSISAVGNDIYIIYNDSTTTASSSFTAGGTLVYKKLVVPYDAANMSAAMPLSSVNGPFAQVWRYASSTYSDETADSASTATADISMVSAIGDMMYFGQNAPFLAVSWLLSTIGTTGVQTWEYWNGSSWTVLTLQASQNSGNFTGSSTGQVMFTPPVNWQTTTVNGESTARYYVRVRVTTAYGTAPVGTQFAANPPLIRLTSLANSNGGLQLLWTETGSSSSPYYRLVSMFHSFNQVPQDPASLTTQGLHNGYVTSTTPTLSFSLSDPDAGNSLRYQLQVDDAADFSSPIIDYSSALAGQGNRQFTVGQADSGGSYAVGSTGQTLPDGAYYWRVRANDGEDQSGYVVASGSPVFIVDSTIPTSPGTPTVQTPTSNNQPEVSWSAASDAGSGLTDPAYTLQWSSQSDFGSITGSVTTNNTHAALTSLADGLWYVRVAVSDQAGNQVISNVSQVMVDATMPTAPGIPAASTPTTNHTPTWDWAASVDSGTGLASPAYLISWSRNADMSSAYSATTDQTTFTHTLSLADGTWYVRVQATDMVGNSSVSGIGQIILTTPPEPTPTPAPTAAPTATPTPTPTTTPAPTSSSTPTSTPVNSPTPTPTVTVSIPQASASATPTPPSELPADTKIVLTIKPGSQQPDRPMLTGYTLPFAWVEVTVHSTPQTGRVQANKNGFWSWTPPQPLSKGSHSYTAQLVNEDGSLGKMVEEVNFTVGQTVTTQATWFLWLVLVITLTLTAGLSFVFYLRFKKR